MSENAVSNPMKGKSPIAAGPVVKALAVSALCLTIGVLLYLSLANPQSSKWIYIFQAYVCPKRVNKHGVLVPPPNYTGEWRTWHRNGQLWGEVMYVSGTLHGDAVEYYPNGQLLIRARYSKGELDGEVRRWRANGDLWRISNAKSGKLHGVVQGYDEQGNLVRDEIWENGVMIQPKKEGEEPSGAPTDAGQEPSEAGE